jgi:hypothetical protein
VASDLGATLGTIPGSLPLSNDDLAFQKIVDAAWSAWGVVGMMPDGFEIDYVIAPLPRGVLGTASVSKWDERGLPASAVITLSPDAGGYGWYVDATPDDNSEFSQVIYADAMQAVAGVDAYGRYDLLTTVAHEIGHVLGFMSSNPSMTRDLQSIGGETLFVGSDFIAHLSDDMDHLDDEHYPHDLMNHSLQPGVRKLPSELNVQIINAIREPWVWPGVDGEGAASLPVRLPEADAGHKQCNLVASDRWYVRLDADAALKMLQERSASLALAAEARVSALLDLLPPSVTPDQALDWLAEDETLAELFEAAFAEDGGDVPLWQSLRVDEPHGVPLAALGGHWEDSWQSLFGDEDENQDDWLNFPPA